MTGETTPAGFPAACFRRPRSAGSSRFSRSQASWFSYSAARSLHSLQAASSSARGRAPPPPPPARFRGAARPPRKAWRAQGRHVRSGRISYAGSTTRRSGSSSVLCEHTPLIVSHPQQDNHLCRPRSPRCIPGTRHTVTRTRQNLTANARNSKLRAARAALAPGHAARALARARTAAPRGGGGGDAKSRSAAPLIFIDFGVHPFAPSGQRQHPKLVPTPWDPRLARSGPCEGRPGGRRGSEGLWVAKSRGLGVLEVASSSTRGRGRAPSGAVSPAGVLCRLEPPGGPEGAQEPGMRAGVL